METWHDRLNAEMSRLDMRPVDLARACDLKPPSVHDWMTGKTRRIEGDNLVAAAKALKVTAEWLMTGKGRKRIDEAPAADFVDTALPASPAGSRPIAEWDGESSLPVTHEAIQRLEVHLSAGLGQSSVDDTPKRLTPNVFRTDFLRSAGWSPRTHFSMFVEGDSMEPTVPDGSTVVVDITVKEPKGNKSSMFAIMVDGEPRLKRLLKLPSGAIRVSSDNQHPDYSSFDVGPESRHQLEVIGKVVYMQTKLD